MRLAELREEQARYVRGKLRRTRMLRLGLLLLLVLALCIVNAVRNRTFGITVYEVPSDRVAQGFRIALLSDLHNHEYGAGNYELVEALRQSRPDLILLAGDMVNADDTDIHVVMDFCESIKRIAPVYYFLGNHEGVLMYARDGDEVALDTRLMQIGIPVSYLGTEETVVRGNPVALGVFPYSAEEAGRITEEEIAQFEQSEGFRIMVSHYPSVFYEKLYGVDAELAVAGHYHGGQVRLPLIGGLYHMDDGLFPRYSGGKYALGRAVLVVSRGLGGHGGLPRVNNQPELVLIDVKPDGETGQEA